MKRASTVTLVALLLLAGCAGTRTPKLARCTGPYRYANPYGTVLPTPPIPGKPLNPPDAPAPVSPPSATAPAVEPDPSVPSPSASTPSGADRAQPGKTSGLSPSYPSC
ncbi:hypothetical protein [Sphingomonas oryzagri]